MIQIFKSDLVFDKYDCVIGLFVLYDRVFRQIVIDLVNVFNAFFFEHRHKFHKNMSRSSSVVNRAVVIFKAYAEMRRNYEQLNEWSKEDGVDVAMEKLRRCACDALQTEEIVVENIDDEKTVQALSQSYKKQEDEFIKRAVMMAAGRRAGKQGAARLPLSGDEVQRKIEAAKTQMSMGAFRRRV